MAAEDLPAPPPANLDAYFRDLGERLGMQDYLAGAAERLAVTAALIEGQLDGAATAAHLVDLGAFPGALSLYARERLGVPRVSAVTLASSDAFTGLMEARGVEVLQADLERRPTALPAASADVVLFCEVLEHLLHPHAVLREIRRLLRPGGLLVASSPNLGALRFRLRLLAGLPILDPLPDDALEGGDEAAASYRPHVRTYLLSEADALFAGAGFRRVALRWCEHTLHRPGAVAWVRRQLRRAVTAWVPPLRDTWVMALRPT